jgi:hypothetical protein
MQDRTDLDALAMRVIDLEQWRRRVVVADRVAPRWATARDEMDGGIRWTREASAPVQPTLINGPDESVSIMALLTDRLEVAEDGAIAMVRDDDVEIYVDDDRMTLAQARTFGELILQLVDAVEAGQ